MTKLIAFCVSVFMLGAAHAMEVQDAPISEPNYLGIVIFLLLFVGGSAWFIWSIVHKGKQDKQNKQIHAR